MSHGPLRLYINCDRSDVCLLQFIVKLAQTHTDKLQQLFIKCISGNYKSLFDINRTAKAKFTQNLVSYYK